MDLHSETDKARKTATSQPLAVPQRMCSSTYGVMAAFDPFLPLAASRKPSEPVAAVNIHTRLRRVWHSLAGEDLFGWADAS